MTKGDKIKLRADLAGRAMESLISASITELTKTASQLGIKTEQVCACIAVGYADALMAELGIKGEE